MLNKYGISTEICVIDGVNVGKYSAYMEPMDALDVSVYYASVFKSLYAIIHVLCICFLCMIVENRCFLIHIYI